ncbi:MAG: hypothetical protein LBT59_12030 [Clostridiales bacterium]|jgi:hypothetical protein|nr:hypothetical protein [Clostridiales bacterium]
MAKESHILPFLWLYGEDEETLRSYGIVTVPSRGPCFSYNAWDNRLEAIEHQENNDSTDLKVFLDPRKSLIVIFGNPQGFLVWSQPKGLEVEVKTGTWTRSICEIADYPNFAEENLTIVLVQNGNRYEGAFLCAKNYVEPILR